MGKGETEKANIGPRLLRVKGRGRESDREKTDREREREREREIVRYYYC